MVAGPNVETKFLHSAAEERGIRLQAPARLVGRGEQVEHGERCGDDRGRDGVREEVWSGALPEKGDDLGFAAGEAAAGATKRLAQRAGNDVHAVRYTAQL